MYGFGAMNFESIPIRQPAPATTNLLNASRKRFQRAAFGFYLSIPHSKMRILDAAIRSIAA
ncbi:MAG: hypothetical protein ACI9HX_001150 [Pseudoalteromonas tetraodonis]|jgi:hypothetical protein